MKIKMGGKKSGNALTEYSTGPLKQGLKKGSGVPKDGVEPKPRKMPAGRGKR